MNHTEAWKRSSPNEIKIGLISISDRASKGIYTDEGIPALQLWLQTAISTPCVFHERLIADEQEVITETIVELCDVMRFNPHYGWYRPFPQRCDPRGNSRLRNP